MSSVYAEWLGRFATADWADIVIDGNAVKRRAPHVFRLGAPAPAGPTAGEARSTVAQAA